jgi:hypothetical protein
MLTDEPILHAKTTEVAAKMVISGFKASLKVPWYTQTADYTDVNKTSTDINKTWSTD